MDVIFETSDGQHFIMEIGFFDTVLEIKEKVQKYKGLPVSCQRLLFNGQELADDREIQHCDIVQDSRIQLVVVPDTDPAPPKETSAAAAAADAEEVAAGAAAAANAFQTVLPRVKLVVKIPLSKRQLSIDVDPAETVLRLKQRIHDSEGIPMNRFVLHQGADELQDHRALGEHGVADRGEITVNVRPPPVSPVASGSGGGVKRLKVTVKCGTKKWAVEVSASDNVGELRKELEWLQGQGQLSFHLPADGYFFIHKHNVMEEDKSFRWHDVRSGDAVEIIDGAVTTGS